MRPDQCCAWLGEIPFVAKAFADAGHTADSPATATSITIDIVRKPKNHLGLAVHQWRWVM